MKTKTSPQVTIVLANGKTVHCSKKSAQARGTVRDRLARSFLKEERYIENLLDTDEPLWQGSLVD